MTCFKLLFPMPASTKENSEKLYRQKFHSSIWSRSAKVSARNSVLERKSWPILKCGVIIHIFKISHMTIKCYWSVRGSVSFSPFVPQFHFAHLLQQFHFSHLVPLFHVSHLVSQFNAPYLLQHYHVPHVVPRFHIFHLFSHFHIPHLVPEIRFHIFSKFL